MSDQTLFNQEQTTSDAPVADQQQEAPTTSGYEAMLQGIKTADGRQKYGTISDALNSISNKEQHISTLEGENAALRDQIKELKAALEAASVVPNNTGNGSTPTADANAAIDFDSLTKKVYEQVTASMTAQEKAAQRQARINEFKNKFVGVYGEKASEVYSQKLAESGLSENILLDAEVASPGAAWKFLGLEKPTTVEPSTIPSSTRNSSVPTQRPAETEYKFRPTNQQRPGSKFAAQREETLKRLGVTLD